MNHSPQGGAPDGASQPPTMTLTDHLHHDGIDVLIDPPAQLRQWFANSERIFRRPFWKDLVTSSAERPAPHFSELDTRKMLQCCLVSSKRVLCAYLGSDSKQAKRALPESV